MFRHKIFTTRVTRYWQNPMAKTFIEAFRAGELRVNPPLSETDVDNIVAQMTAKPSDAAISLWKKIGSGGLPMDWDIEVAKPGSEVVFVKGGRYGGYEGSRQMRGTVCVKLGTLWPGTDSTTDVLEVLTGDNKGKLVACAYGDLSVYLSSMDTEEAFGAVKKIPVDTDWSEVSTMVWNDVFDNKKIGDGTDTGEEEEEAAEQGK